MINISEQQRREFWAAGYDAFETNQPREANPYPKGYSSNIWWDHGWTEGLKDKMDELMEARR